MPKGFLERVNVSTVAINGVGGLLTALMAWYAPEKYKLPQPYSSYILWAIAAVFIFIVLRAAILAVPLRSVLRDPDAFVLRRELPQHLVGREDDLDRLQKKLHEASLLFVEGESGVGKSALLSAGLAPKLTTGHRYLPVYVESLAGRDWVEGPWRAVLPAFRAALADKAPAPGLKPVAEAFHELLEAARETGRVPVLIIDQFDDYQLSHAALFLRAGTWLRATELTAENPFWAALDAALAGSRLQLVIATRNDMASGLEAARFVAPQTYRVHKVDPTYLGQLIERLSAPANGATGAIDAPLATWPDLRVRLLDDLASRGAILPQQLKIALLGLPGLPRQQLTITGYLAVGGVRGLEANWIETQIDRAARESKLSTADILRLLVALCEPDAVAKTRELPLPALCEAAGVEDRTAVETALTALKEGKVVRQLPGADRNESVWRLDHDYIAGIVDVANRRANRWTLTLLEGRTAFAAASGVVRKWEALLPFRTQIQFFLDRFMGRFRYESSRAYALISLAKFAPVMLAVLLAALGYDMIQTRARSLELAARVSAGFDTDPRLSDNEARSLINLSLSNTTVARGVIGLMLDEPATTENLSVQLRPVIAALDLAADGNWTTLAETAKPFAENARGSQGVIKSYVVAMLLDQAGQASDAATLLVEAMGTQQNNIHRLVWLAGALGGLGDGVPHEKAALAADRLVAAMEANKDNSLTLHRLAGGMGAFADRVPQQATDQAATILVTAMVADNSHRVALGDLASGLAAIAAHVSPETAGMLAPRLVAAIEANKSSTEPVPAFADGLAAIADRVPQPIAGNLVSRLRTAIDAPNDNADALARLARALGAFRDRVTQQTADLAANRLVAAMESNKGNATTLSQLAGGLGAIADRVPQETVGLGVTRLVAAMDANKGDRNALPLLAGGVGAIADRVPQEAVDLAASRFVAAMAANEKDFQGLARLADGLGAIGDRVPRDTVDRAAARLVTAMEANKHNLTALAWLAESLAAIGDRVPKTTAGQLAARLITVMEANKLHARTLSELGEALGAVGSQVPKVDAQPLAVRLDALLPRCDITMGCHVARIALHGVLSRERAIQLSILAIRDPFEVHNVPAITERLARLTGSDFKHNEGSTTARAWLRKHRTIAGVDDASIRKELRELMQKREAISRAKMPDEAGQL